MAWAPLLCALLRLQAPRLRVSVGARISDLSLVSLSSLIAYLLALLPRRDASSAASGRISWRLSVACRWTHGPWGAASARSYQLDRGDTRPVIDHRGPGADAVCVCLKTRGFGGCPSETSHIRPLPSSPCLSLLPPTKLWHQVTVLCRELGQAPE